MLTLSFTMLSKRSIFFIY